MNYEFNIPKYIADLLPVILRKPKTLEWLHCLTFPIDNLHSQEVVPFIDFVREELKFNSKTAVLEYYLRKNYAGNSPYITIVNANNPEPDLFIGREDDFLYEVFLGRTNEDPENIIINRNGVQLSNVFDFDVKLNDTFAHGISEYVMSQIVASIEKYKTLGRRFRIVNESNTEQYFL